MAYDDRQELYRAIEDQRERPLLTYVTSSRPQASGNMAQDAIPQFTKQLSALNEPDQDGVDLLVVSSGGDPTVAWRVISLLRECFGHVSILVPDAAYSAATLLALGADEILMHPFSNLGPVDPQITYIDHEDGEQPRQRGFAAEDLRHFISFVEEDVGLSDQEQMQKAFDYLCKEVGATQIGFAKRSTHLSISMGEKLLQQHMEDEKEAAAIAEALSRSFYHHGYPLGRTEAEEIGLPVTEPGDEMKSLMREVWKDFEEEMKCSEPFSPMEKVLESDEGDKLLRGSTQVNIPNGLSRKQTQQVYQSILQDHVDIATVEPVDYTLFQASVESLAGYSHYRQEGKIFAQRLPDSRIHVNRVPVSAKWAFH